MYGQAATFTVTGAATAPGSGFPTGQVTILSDGVVVGHATFDAAGHATLALSSLTSGTHQLTVSYPGDTNFLPAAAAGSHLVDQGSVSVTVASSRNPSRRGRNVVFTATLTSPHATPAGSVTFMADGNVLGRGEVVAGVATYTDRTLTKKATPWTLTAQYEPTAQFNSATGTLSGGQVVENSPPVAGAGTALDLGPTAAQLATIRVDQAFDAGDLTLEAWARPAWSAPEQAGATPTVVRLGSDATEQLALGLSPDRTQVTYSVAGTTHAVAAPVDDLAWHHLALTAQGDQLRLYVDGLLADTQTATRAGAGRDLVLGNGFVGQLDEVRAWTMARTAEQLRADAMRPLDGATEGLAGAWRLDEGTGTELFDSTAGAHDGTVTLSSGATVAFAPSQAWRLRQVSQERDLLPAAHAGYDVDGDPLDLTIAVAAGHGQTRTDATAMQVHYRAGAGFLGTDTFTFRLADGDAQSDYELQLEVSRILTCRVSADCGGGDLCLQGVCVAPAAVQATAGGCGCTSGGGSATGLWLLVMIGLLYRHRRRPAAVRATRTGLFLALAVTATAAQAQTPDGFYLQTLEPTPAGDTFFVSPDAGVANRGPAASLFLSWATDPLVLRKDGAVIPGGRIVHRQFWGWAQASLPLFDRVLLDVAAPVSLFQTGSQPYPDLPKVTAAALGDLRVGARVELLRREAYALAAAADVWFATGSVPAFASDAALRLEPKLVISGERGPVVWSGGLGYHYRPERDVSFTVMKSAVTFTAGGAWRFGEFRVGPELYGRLAPGGSKSSPFEALLGGHWSRGSWDTGVGLGTAFDQAPGAAPFRAVARVTWLPNRGEAALAAARAAAEREAAAKAAAEKAEADRLAAEQAALAQAAAAKSAAEQAEADRLAAEQAALAQAAAARAAAEQSKLITLTKEKIEIREAIQFETNKDVIRPESEPVLAAVANVLKTHPEIVMVRIEGYTDSLGPEDYNLQLSQKRAVAVWSWMVEKGGIEAARLQAKGFGQTRPIADNATPEGRARNRRVEFNLEP